MPQPEIAKTLMSDHEAWASPPAQTDNIQALVDILPDAIPWAAFLPADDLVAMLVELVQLGRGTATIENLAPVAVLLTQWRHSAEVYADPELFAALSREPEGDLGCVPVPEVSPLAVNGEA
jgi:hypothetical protein